MNIRRQRQRLVGGLLTLSAAMLLLGAISATHAASPGRTYVQDGTSGSAYQGPEQSQETDLNFSPPSPLPPQYYQQPPQYYQEPPPQYYQQLPPQYYQQLPPQYYQQLPPQYYQQLPPQYYQQPHLQTRPGDAFANPPRDYPTPPRQYPNPSRSWPQNNDRGFRR